ncbi:hypothetical protein ABZ816_11610 [Actinosynnema sp. NPDC047251]|uniref:hypothetical protein n=1 Tax=Saccharothrix espanaensis TaxID=103731 RepID=UPI0002EB4014|nr:hypothetical protein [Saccharothrix espanaensis]
MTARLTGTARPAGFLRFTVRPAVGAARFAERASARPEVRFGRPRAVPANARAIEGVQS